MLLVRQPWSPNLPKPTPHPLLVAPFDRKWAHSEPQWRGKPKIGMPEEAHMVDVDPFTPGPSHTELADARTDDGFVFYAPRDYDLGGGRHVMKGQPLTAALAYECGIMVVQAL